MDEELLVRWAPNSKQVTGEKVLMVQCPAWNDRGSPEEMI